MTESDGSAPAAGLLPLAHRCPAHPVGSTTRAFAQTARAAATLSAKVPGPIPDGVLTIARGNEAEEPVRTRLSEVLKGGASKSTLDLPHCQAASKRRNSLDCPNGQSRTAPLDRAALVSGAVLLICAMWDLF
jgi:hypothetical protein